MFIVGTQRRTERDLLVRAVNMVRKGLLGDIKRIKVGIRPSTVGGPFPKLAPPKDLDWNFWLGQTPKVDYIAERCHYNFRWWYEYSGGKFTDWGAQNVDIAQWAIGMENTGPLSVEPISFTLPVPFEKGYPTVDDCYNTAVAFNVKCMFPNGVELILRHDTDTRHSF